jgi:hypothetical protein
MVVVVVVLLVLVVVVVVEGVTVEVFPGCCACERPSALSTCIIVQCGT